MRPIEADLFASLTELVLTLANQVTQGMTTGARPINVLIDIVELKLAILRKDWEKTPPL